MSQTGPCPEGFGSARKKKEDRACVPVSGSPTPSGGGGGCNFLFSGWRCTKAWAGRPEAGPIRNRICLLRARPAGPRVRPRPSPTGAPLLGWVRGAWVLGAWVPGCWVPGREVAGRPLGMGIPVPLSSHRFESRPSRPSGSCGARRRPTRPSPWPARTTWSWTRASPGPNRPLGTLQCWGRGRGGTPMLGWALWG